MSGQAMWRQGAARDTEAGYSAVFPYSKTREKHRLLLGSGL